MIRAIFDNLHNMWGSWVKTAAVKQNTAMILGGLCLLYHPIMQYADVTASTSVAEAELEQKREQLAHRRQILQALKKQSDTARLTPELAGRLLPVNRRIQQIGGELQIIHSHWQFEQTPQLRLELEGHFAEIKAFLTALLQQMPQLALTALHIRKADEESGFSVYGEISLQLRAAGESE